MSQGFIKDLQPVGNVQSVNDDGNNVVIVDNTDPFNPVIQFGGVYTDGITITGDGSVGSPLIALGIGYSVTNVSTTPYAILPTSGIHIYLVDATISSITIDFPTSVGNTAIYTIKKIDSSVNTVVLDPNGAETLDGQTTQTIRFQNTSLDIYSDNANLYIK